MSQLIKIEFSRAFCNRKYYVALIIGVLLALVSAVYGIQNHEMFLPAEMSSTIWGPTSMDSCYIYWMSLHNTVPFEGLLYQLAPLLATIPYACSMRQELDFGYANHIFSRTPRSKYFIAKYLATFVSGGCVTLIPSTVNFVTLACFVPAYVPSVEQLLYTGVHPEMLWSHLFYTNPLLYVVLYSLVAFVLCGLWAAAVLGLSFVVHNRVALVSGSYLVALLSGFVSARIYVMLGYVVFPEFSLIELMRACEVNLSHTFFVMGVWAFTLLVVSFALPMFRLGDDVL